MRELTITANDAGRRLDRFLRKYLKNASLGDIYKIIRKDVKVDGRRRSESYMLSEGEVLALYISDEELDRLTGNIYRNSRADAASHQRKARRQFGIIYEDDQILIVSKPYGLLTHGDRHEKKHHLANQVRDYLIETGSYDPRSEKVFSPAPANRLDRNTTGLVLFGKTAASLKALGEVIRDDKVSKYYLTVACGAIDRSLMLEGTLSKDEERNTVRVSTSSQAEGSDAKQITTGIEPIGTLDLGRGCTATLVRVHLITGRSHQIRAHLASIGHPVAGDGKYANAKASDASVRPADAAEIRRLNEHLAQEYHLTTQLLHAYEIRFNDEGLPDELSHLAGQSFKAPLPPAFRKILSGAGLDFDISDMIDN